MANNTYQVVVQLKDLFKEVNINDSGAVCFVCTAGTATLATITDVNGNSLANPIQLTTGLIKFQYSVSNTAEETQVDLFGMTAGGHWFEYTGIGGIGPTGGPSGPNEIRIDTARKRFRMKIPFAIGNAGPAGACVAGTEFKIGLPLPAPATAPVMVLDRLHGLALQMITIQSGKTINFGILSTETGGSASGFINGSSMAPTAPSLLVTGTNGSFYSTNAPYNSDSETGGVANGLDLSLTLSSGTTTATGFILVPYTKA